MPLKPSSMIETSDPLLLHTLWGSVSNSNKQVVEIDGLILRGKYGEALERGLENVGSLTGHTLSSSDPRLVAIQAYHSAAIEFSQDNVAVREAVERIGIAALLEYMVLNVAGPFGVSKGKVDPGASTLEDEEEILQCISENGEDFVGKIFSPHLLLLAKMSFSVLLTHVKEDAPKRHVLTWWGFRVAACTQYFLSERSQVLLDRINGFLGTLLEGDWIVPEDDDDVVARGLLGVLHVEAANILLSFGLIKRVKYHLEKASVLLGIDATLTGALGTRTVHQQEAHAQLVMKISIDQAMGSFERFRGSQESAVLDDNVFSILVKNNASDPSKGEFSGFDVDSDVFRGGPKLVDPDHSLLMRKDLNSLHQLVLLSLCNYVKKATSPDGTQQWEIAAYAESILTQTRSDFLIRLSGYMELARLEIQRSRTRERALVALEGVKESLVNPDMNLTTHERLAYVFGITCLPRALVWKELGEAFVACGLVGAAMQLFEAAELWDSLIVCYQLLQKNEIAEQLVKKRLEVTPENARLWCTLGDLVDSDEFYEKAWECSNHRSARAQRSLARSAMRRDDFAKASNCWQKALTLSPLHLEAWFSLGWCNMKIDNLEEAAKALTRLVQMDPDDGRAWNNLATVHMKMKNWQEALIAFGEASKHARDTWQTWENYALVACQMKEFNTAARALEHMVTLTRGEMCNIALLSTLVDSLPSSHDTEESTTHDQPGIVTTMEQQLKNYISNILKKIASSSKGSPGFWKIYAKYYATLGETSSEAECLAKHVRSLQTSTWHSQEAEFEEYALSCIQLVECYKKTQNKAGLSQSKMLLRNTLHRSQEYFDSHPAYTRMQNLLDELHNTS
jgi:tetratricopeptide (TPR) repeat protein